METSKYLIDPESTADRAFVHSRLGWRQVFDTAAERQVIDEVLADAVR